MSARQSPPIASEIARSSGTLPGSCTANGLGHGANAADRPRPRPALSAVAASTTAPAWDTTRLPVASTRSSGYSPVDFRIRKVLLVLVGLVPSARPITQVGAPFVMINTGQPRIAAKAAG
jgi:hypothetical protein